MRHQRQRLVWTAVLGACLGCTPTTTSDNAASSSSSSSSSGASGQGSSSAGSSSAAASSGGSSAATSQGGSSGVSQVSSAGSQGASTSNPGSSSRAGSSASGGSVSSVSSGSGGGSSAASALGSSSTMPVDVCVQTPGSFSAVTACFDGSGACTDDVAAGTITFSGGATITSTGGPFNQRRVFVSSAATTCLTQTTAGSAVTLRDGRGCLVEDAPPGAFSAPLCAVRLPPPGFCNADDADGGVRSGAAATACNAAAPACCAVGDPEVVFGQCLTSDLCLTLGGSVVGLFDAGGTTTGTQTLGTITSCQGGPLLNPGAGPAGAMVDLAAAASTFALGAQPGCVGSVAPDVAVRITRRAGVAVELQVTPQPAQDVVAMVVASCPMTLAGGCVVRADRGGPGGVETLVLPAGPAGETTVVVDGYRAGDVGQVTITAVEQTQPCGDGLLTEDACTQTRGPTVGQEWDGTLALATPYAGGTAAFGGDLPAADPDEDHYTFRLARTANVVVTLSSTAPGIACLDADLALYASSAYETPAQTPLVRAYGAPNVCTTLSVLDEPLLGALPAGRYWVAVETSSTGYSRNPMPYRVTVLAPGYGSAPRCAAAVPLAFPSVVAGSTAGGPLGAVDGFNLTLNARCGAGSPAPDVVYALTLAPNTPVEVVVTPQDQTANGPRFSVSVLSSCPATAGASCVNAQAAPQPGGAARTVAFHTGTGMQTVYLVVDGVDAVDRGAFSVDAHAAPPACGDGFPSAGEACDDGNLVTLDGCSPTCVSEITAEVEPNNTRTTATPGVPYRFTGNLLVGEQDWFGFDLPTAAAVILEAGVPAVSNCTSTAASDTVLTLYDANGVHLDDDDDNGPGYCSLLDAGRLAAGRYYVQVTGYGSAIPYSVFLTVTP